MTKQEIIEKIIADGTIVKGVVFASQDGQVFSNSQTANNHWKHLKVPVRLPLETISEKEIQEAKEPKANIENADGVDADLLPKADEVKETQTSKTKK